MSLKIRDARLDDLTFIVDANLAMAEETEDKGLEFDTLREGVRAALLDSGRGSYLMASVEGEPAGCLMVTREWSDWRNRFFWWIQSVYVLPTYRGQKVYSALHRAVLQRAAARDDVCGVRLYVELENRHATRVYESLGMKSAGYNMMEQML